MYYMYISNVFVQYFRRINCWTRDINNVIHVFGWNKFWYKQFYRIFSRHKKHKKKRKHDEIDNSSQGSSHTDPDIAAHGKKVESHVVREYVSLVSISENKYKI